jgi:hypothetical protein
VKLCDEIENEDIAPDVAMDLMIDFLKSQRKVLTLLNVPVSTYQSIA